MRAWGRWSVGLVAILTAAAMGCGPADGSGSQGQEPSEPETPAPGEPVVPEVPAPPTGGNSSGPGSTPTPGLPQQQPPIPVPKQTYTLGAAADVYVNGAHPFSNLNTPELRLKEAPEDFEASFLRFDVSAVRGQVKSATLRLFVREGSSLLPSVWTVPESWEETQVVGWAAPSTANGLVPASGTVEQGTWLELDVTSAMLGGAELSLALVPQGTDELVLASRESPDVDQRPQLVVVTEAETCSPGTPRQVSGARVRGQSWGGSGSQKVSAMAVDAQGNRILLGYYEGSTDFGGGALPNHGTSIISDSDLALIKQRPDGSHLWSRGFGAPDSWMDAVEVAVDAAGNIAVVGHSSGGVNMGAGPLPAGAFVAKFSPEGSLLWAVPQEGIVEHVAFDKTGQVLVAGQVVAEDAPADEWPRQLLVRKLSAQGTQVWLQRFSASERVRGDALATGPSNEVVVGGSYGGSLQLGAVTLEESQLAPFLVKLNAGGEVAWARGFPSASTGSAERGVTNIAVAQDGAIASSGYFSQWLRVGSQVGYGTGQYTGFVSVVEPDGTDRWWRWMGNQHATFTEGVAIDAAGDLVVMGGFRGSLDFGTGPLTTAGSTSNSELPWDGVFVAKYRMACGEPVWSQQLSHGVNFFLGALAVAPDLSILVSGEYGGGDFGPGLPEDADHSYRAALIQLAP